MKLTIKKSKGFYKTGFFILLVILAFVTGVFWQRVENLRTGQKSTEPKEAAVDREKVIPEKGFDLPISWGDLGPKLIAAGVIDEKKFLEAVNLNSDEEKILKEGSDEPININIDNSQFVVDFLWAVGLAQKSNAYTEGPMGKEYKGNVGGFSSTGGWTLAKGDATKYLGKYDLFELTDEQQKRVEEIAKNVYRPCCGNSTWFPDCNHGMAALAAIEMMVAKNLSDDVIYRSVLQLNSFWFSGTYLTTAQYFANQGIPWDKVDAKVVLGAEYSSSQGAAQIAKKVNPIQGAGGGGCGA
ncbi:MAG TPA: hypothetical protein VJ227_01335 [Patescibacteria group bacterium]|nr:hypothetical protein [Patescibacteria group bacterium]